jgi:DNA polymerase-3 subunit epsilon
MAIAAHGLQDWWLRYQPVFQSHAQMLHGQFQAAELLVGHNVDFDVRMINHEFGKADFPAVERPTYCTMQAYRERGLYGSSTLDACLSQLGLCRSGKLHCALEDVLLTTNLFRWLKGNKDHLPIPVPLPNPENAAAIPEEVDWANAVDTAVTADESPKPPQCVGDMLTRYGIGTVGLPPHQIRTLLAACEYAIVLARRTPEHETDRQIRNLIRTLCDHPTFACVVRDWSRWAWGRPNPQIPRDELRAFAEEVLLQATE